jgi:hypothetical protein
MANKTAGRRRNGDMVMVVFGGGWEIGKRERSEPEIFTGARKERRE